MKNLVIVESPTKARTITGFLGKDYKVESSYGHIRDLPRSQLGVDVEKNFEVHYVVPRKSNPNLKKLKSEVKKADVIILATDEDREGEAISWHLVQALKLDELKKDFKRIVFHEITSKAISDALASPRPIDLHLVDAQQARRVLDRLVGYKLSPFLWKKIARGLSAGRVQSVAVRLIAEREEEIKNFKPQEYWSIDAFFSGREKNKIFESDIYKINGEILDRLAVKNEAEAKKITDDIRGVSGTVLKVDRKEIAKNPQPPFITSTLQQEGAKKLHFSSKKTMMLAQRLYEQGHITYMRTDSVNLSQDSLSAAKLWLEKNLGQAYAQSAPRVFKKKSRLAQEAHEAIRPTNISLRAEELSAESDEKKLYDLIWRRFVASQMPQAIFSVERAEISIEGKSGVDYIFTANGSVLKFDGFTRIWISKFEKNELPALEDGDALKMEDLKSEQHFTEPPPRYTEASLIKILEKNGIGRPSTYAPTISTILARNYVEKQSGRFHLTEIGSIVNKLLTEHFPQVVDIEFTAKMEEELDEIAEGKMAWQNTVREFYEPFSKNLAQKYEEVAKEEFTETTDEVCEKCGRPMAVKRSRFGKFLACTGYPECKNTKSLKDDKKLIGLKCPKCGEGDVVEKRVNRGRARGKVFWGCSRYPDCDYAAWENPLLKAEVKSSSEEVEENK